MKHTHTWKPLYNAPTPTNDAGTRFEWCRSVQNNAGTLVCECGRLAGTSRGYSRGGGHRVNLFPVNDFTNTIKATAARWNDRVATQLAAPAP